MTMKLLGETAEPPGAMTDIGPVVAPAGTVAEMEVELMTMKEAVVPLKVTDVVPLKPEPWMETTVPTGPDEGLKEVMIGGGITVNMEALLANPPGVNTWNKPVVAPIGMVAAICVALTTEKGMEEPLSLRSVAPVKFKPVMVTDVP